MSNPIEAVDEGRMSFPQLRAVAIGVAIHTIDGYDVLAISFAAPGIFKEWHLTPAALGIVLSMELIGMAAGSLLLGRLADSVGRRRTIIGCLAVTTLMMTLSAAATSIAFLCVCRFVTGVMIGGIMPAMLAMVTEVSSRRARDTSLSLMSSGYMIGAILGGSLASLFLGMFDWRSLFLFGGALTGIVLILTVLWVPETVTFLVSRRPANALARVNATLALFGRAGVGSLPERSPTARKPGIAALFRRDVVRDTVAVTLAYLFQSSTFYFLVKWVPKEFVDLGHSPAAAAMVLVYLNIGGLAGALLVGPLAMRFGMRRVSISLLSLSPLLVFLLSNVEAAPGWLVVQGILAGFVVTGGVTSLFALIARTFAGEQRTTGIGFAMGVGRGTAAFSPVMAGFLFSHGLSFAMVAPVIAAGSLIGAAMIYISRQRA